MAEGLLRLDYPDGAILTKPQRIRDYFTVCPRVGKVGRSFRVDTIHISCKSDPYRGSSHLYGGIIIYVCQGEGEWCTPNGTHCKSGYVVIMETDTKEFKEL